MNSKENQTAEDLYAARNDPSEWESSPTEITVSPRKTEIVSFRLPSDELDQLEEAAASVGETVSQYVREALALRVGGSARMEPEFNFMAGKASFVVQVDTKVWGSSRAEGHERQFKVPDSPPQSVNVTG